MDLLTQPLEEMGMKPNRGLQKSKFLTVEVPEINKYILEC